MYYGWFVVSGALFSQVAMVGFFSYVFSLLVLPLQTSFDASRTEVMYSMSFTAMLGLFLAPAIGVMADKYPIRWLMALGAAIFGGGLFALSLTQTLLQFTLLFGLVMGLSNQLLGPLCGSAIISRWFTDSRGKALGLAATGSSLGGILLPALFVYWLEDDGDWRSALQNLSYGVLFILLPYLIIVMRDFSQQQQVNQTNQNIEDNPLKQNSEHNEYTLKQIIKDSNYWIVGISMALLFSTYSALLANLTPYLLGQGLDKAIAAQAIMVIAISGLVGKISFGYAADKVSLRLALSVTQLAVIGGLLLLAAGPSYWVITLALAILGLSTGGMLPVWGALLAAIFGTVSYGRVMGLMMPLIVLIVIPGYSLAGYLSDQSGSYGLCFVIFSAVIAISMPLALMLKLPSNKSADSTR
ncbi:MFS transporter [Porticoccaceae bacterium]|nr:MFS transporter [Porticoccaceae bacterium]